MTQPETNLPTLTLKSYLSLKLSRAAKTGSRSQGYIHYRILKDLDQELLHIAIVANDGGGCYSKEIVSFEKIEQCLQKIDLSKTIASKQFEQAFVGKSSNNAGFMAAILRAELLLMPSPSSMHQHAIQPDWSSWKTAMFALTNTAEHYQPEPPKPRIMQKSIKEPSHEDQQSNQQMIKTIPSKQKPLPTPPIQLPEPEMILAIVNSKWDCYNNLRLVLASMMKMSLK